MVPPEADPEHSEPGMNAGSDFATDP